LRNLERMRQSGPVMIAHWNEEDLGFMFQSPKRLRMDDSISVMLEGGPEGTFLLKRWAAFRPCTQCRKRREALFLPLFQLLPDCLRQLTMLHLIEYAILANLS
jgi:hypothetical protein